MIERLKEKIDKKKVIKLLMVFALVVIILNVFKNVAYADGLLDEGSNNPFNGIREGWGQFINDPYRNNYNLDAGDVGFLDVIDKGLNAFANFIFGGMLIVSWLGVSIFNFCFTSNISGKFEEVIQGVSQALKTGIFDQFFMLMFVISIISVLIYFAKRNYAAAVNHILIVALLSIMAGIFSSSSASKFVMETLNISNDIGMTLVSSLSGEANTANAINNMNGTLWGNLVHKPWIILEYDGKVSVEDYNQNEAIRKSKEMLSLSKNSDERKELAKTEIKDVSMTSRLAATLILFLINVVKIGILMILGVIQIFLQILSNIMILIAPVLLLLAIVPFFGGLNMLKWLGQKYLGIQLNIILLSFAIGVLIVIDKVVLEFFMGMGTSFTVALLIQSVCWVLLIVFRKQIVLNFTKVQRRLNGTIAAGRLMNKMLDKEVEAGKWAAEKAGAVGEKATRPIRYQAVNMKDLALKKVQYASKYVTGNTKLAAAKTTADIIDKAAVKWDSIRKSKNEEYGENVSAENVKENNNNVNFKNKINNSKNALKDKLSEVRKSNIVGVNFNGEQKGNTHIKDVESKNVVKDINNVNSNEELKDKIQEVKNKEIESADMKDIQERNRLDSFNNEYRNDGVEDRTEENKVENLENSNMKDASKHSNSSSNEELKDKIQEIKNKEIESTDMKDIQERDRLDTFNNDYRNDGVENRTEENKVENLENSNMKDVSKHSNSSSKEELKDKIQEVKNKEIESADMKDIQERNRLDSLNNKHRNDGVEDKIEKSKVENSETIKMKDVNSAKKTKDINNNREIESSNLSINEVKKRSNLEKNNEEPKIISFNQARVKMGKEEVNSDKLKENLRKNLQKEYRTEKKLKSEELQKANQKTRAEILKSRLGISSTQIKKQERNLNKELNKIKNRKTKNINKNH